MNRAGSRRAVLFVVLAAALLSVRPARAEDTKGKWQFGFGFTYFATSDYIRSNSDIAIASNAAGGNLGLPPVTSVDARPDQNMLNEPTVHDDFRFDVKASYGLTRWLAVELTAGYMTTSVGNIEYFFQDTSVSYGGSPAPIFSKPFCGPNQDQLCYDYVINGLSTVTHNLFVPVGTITEKPISLSALIRFRPESPLDPYVGLGLGYLFTDLQTADEFNSKSQDVASLLIATASEGEFTDEGRADKTPPEGVNGFHPAPMVATVSSGMTWHAVGGVDYFLNQHVSVFLDARFTWTDAEVNITTDGAHQVLLSTYAPGKLQKFRTDGVWEDRGIAGCAGCPATFAGDGMLETEDGNGNGLWDVCVPGQPCTFNEDGGSLYLMPSGPNPNRVGGAWKFGDPGVTELNCSNSTCPWANDHRFDTEDQNGNRYFDRFRYYGVDVCSLQNPDRTICSQDDIDQTGGIPHYMSVGEGCVDTMPNAIGGNFLAEGCPVPHDANLHNTGGDNPTDHYIIQGGQIRLGGFSFGVGVKFTF